MRGYTKKPCHGCGKVGERERPIDSVCESCVKLLEEARDERERQANLPGTVVRKHNDVWHWNPTYYDGDDLEQYPREHARDRLAKAMTALVFTIGTPARGVKRRYETLWLLKPKLPGARRRHSPDYGGGGERTPTLHFTKPQVAALIELDNAFRELHVNATKAAFDHGADLLRRLGEGDLSLTDFESKQD
jgi:hypothetical protein